MIALRGARAAAARLAMAGARRAVHSTAGHRAVAPGDVFELERTFSMDDVRSLGARTQTCAHTCFARRVRPDGELAYGGFLQRFCLRIWRPQPAAPGGPRGGLVPLPGEEIH